MNPVDFDLDLFFSLEIVFDECFPLFKLMVENHESFNAKKEHFANIFSGYSSPFLIHIATAGAAGIHEKFYKVSNHSKIRKKIRQCPGNLICNYEISPNLDKILAEKRSFLISDRVLNPGPIDKDQYLLSFEDYAKHGFFSFDRTNIHDPEDDRYHLVAYPKLLNNNHDLLKYLLGKNSFYLMKPGEIDDIEKILRQVDKIDLSNQIITLENKGQKLDFELKLIDV